MINGTGSNTSSGSQPANAASVAGTDSPKTQHTGSSYSPSKSANKSSRFPVDQSPSAWIEALDKNPELSTSEIEGFLLIAENKVSLIGQRILSAATHPKAGSRTQKQKRESARLDSEAWNRVVSKLRSLRTSQDAPIAKALTTQQPDKALTTSADGIAAKNSRQNFDSAENSTGSEDNEGNEAPADDDQSDQGNDDTPSTSSERTIIHEAELVNTESEIDDETSSSGQQQASIPLITVVAGQSSTSAVKQGKTKSKAEKITQEFRHHSALTQLALIDSSTGDDELRAIANSVYEVEHYQKCLFKSEIATSKELRGILLLSAIRNYKMQSSKDKDSWATVIADILGIEKSLIPFISDPKSRQKNAPAAEASRTNSTKKEDRVENSRDGDPMDKILGALSSRAVNSSQSSNINTLLLVKQLISEPNLLNTMVNNKKWHPVLASASEELVEVLIKSNETYLNSLSKETYKFLNALQLNTNFSIETPIDIKKIAWIQSCLVRLGLQVLAAMGHSASNIALGVEARENGLTNEAVIYFKKALTKQIEVGSDLANPDQVFTAIQVELQKQTVKKYPSEHDQTIQDAIIQYRHQLTIAEAKKMRVSSNPLTATAATMQTLTTGTASAAVDNPAPAVVFSFKQVLANGSQTARALRVDSSMTTIAGQSRRKNSF